jgi:hypothetical protein
VSCRGLLAALLGALLVVVLASGCEASTSDPACQRLQDFSCHCFPLCQLDYSSIIDSQDAQACDKALTSAYDKWKRCQGSCTVSCEYGWGTCAFSHYREVGRSPALACGAGGKDAGSDGS